MYSRLVSKGRKVIFKNLTTERELLVLHPKLIKKKFFDKTQRVPEIKKKEKTSKTLETETLYFNIII